MKDQEVIDKLVLMLVSGVSIAAAQQSAIDKLGLSESRAKRLLKRAQTAITRAADFSRDEEIGVAYHRINDLYSRSVKAQDVKTALAAQRELNRLMALYEQPTEETTHEIDETSKTELELIAQHLLPLGIAPDGYPLHEVARIAADRLRQQEVT